MSKFESEPAALSLPVDESIQHVFHRRVWGFRVAHGILFTYGLWLRPFEGDDLVFYTLSAVALYALASAALLFAPHVRHVNLLLFSLKRLFAVVGLTGFCCMIKDETLVQCILLASVTCTGSLLTLLATVNSSTTKAIACQIIWFISNTAAVHIILKSRIGVPICAIITALLMANWRLYWSAVGPSGMGDTTPEQVLDGTMFLNPSWEQGWLDWRRRRIDEDSKV